MNKKAQFTRISIADLSTRFFIRTNHIRAVKSMLRA